MWNYRKFKVKYLQIKFYRNTAMLIHVHIIYGDFVL